MKIVITGHTGLLGQRLVELFPNDEVIGMSRTTGYNLISMYDQCLEIMKTADIVINNGYIRDVQARIITDLKDSGVTLITIGSISGYYPERSEYGASKRMIHDTFHQNKRYYANRCLLVVPGVMEENEQCKRINAKVIDIDQVLNGIKYFLNNRRVTLLEFDNIRAG